MSSGSQDYFDKRVAAVRGELETLGADALLVSHLPNVAWLTGFPGSFAAIVLARGTLHFITDPRYRLAIEQRVATGDFPSDARVNVTDRGIDTTVAAIVETLAIDSLAIEGEHVPVRRFRHLEAQLPKGSRLMPVEPFMERQRSVKDAAELAIYREAAQRLAEVARGVPEMLREGRSEHEIAAEIDFAMRRNGFARPAFDTIVASGPNSALPHARPTDRRLGAGDPLVLDFGGVYGGYCVDLTRTAFVGYPTKEFLAVVEAVTAAQAAAVAAVREGARASEIDAAARGLLATRGLADFFAHATGHGLGLDVHEYPRIGRPLPDGDDPVLRSGMVITIEPGAYVPGLGGARIEDDVLVGPHGAEVLTDIPRTLMRAGAR